MKRDVVQTMVGKHIFQRPGQKRMPGIASGAIRRIGQLRLWCIYRGMCARRALLPPEPHNREDALTGIAFDQIAADNRRLQFAGTEAHTGG